MAALKCEICGGGLIGKPGGVFECEYCGVQYDTSWAKAKIQEIKGTVQVEGTVEVTGTVKVEGSANIESLLKRGYLALEDENWEEADIHFDEALNYDAECAEAYIGRLLASFQIPNMAGLACSERDYEQDNNFKKAMRFADTSLKADLTEKLEASRPLVVVHKAHLSALRERAAKAERLFVAPEFNERAFFIKIDGTIHIDSIKTNDEYYKMSHNKFCDSLSAWEDIIEVAYGEWVALGLRSNGSVCSVDSLDSRETCNVESWRDVTRIGLCKIKGREEAVGLLSNGTVITTGSLDLCSWSDIISISCSNENIIGVKNDGTVVTNGEFDLSNWDDIVAADSGQGFAVGLRSDGTVLLEGKTVVKNDWGKEYDLTQIRTWTDIISIHASGRCVVGLQANGTMVGAGLVSAKLFAKNSIAFDIHYINNAANVYGLKIDGTIECNGELKSGWKLFDNWDNLDQERLEARKKREEELYQKKLRREKEEAEKRRKQEEEKRIALEKEAEAKRLAEEKAAEEKRKDELRAKGLCPYCGGTFKGLFIKKCVNCGKEKDYIQ